MTDSPEGPEEQENLEKPEEKELESKSEEDDSDLDYLDDLPEIEYPDEPKNKINRGDEINLMQKDPTIKDIMIGVGWDLKAFESTPLDLDASVFLLDRNDKTRVDEDFIFYNNLTGCDGAIKHMGDSRTGAGDGDDEIIMVSLQSLPFDVMKVSFVLSIYDMDFLGHDFSMVKNVYFRVVNQETDHEMFRYELDEELVGSEGLVIGTMERLGTEWIFTAVGETVDGGLGRIAEKHGIIVAQVMSTSSGS